MCENLQGTSTDAVCSWFSSSTMNRCLLYSLLPLVFSFVLLFPIPTMCTSYQIYLKSESFQKGSEVLRCPENRVEANCKVGRTVQYLPSAGIDLTHNEFRNAMRRAIRQAKQPNMTEWKAFNLTEDGAAYKLTVDDTTLPGVGVGELAVECEFKGQFSFEKKVSGSKKKHASSGKNSMKVKVFDVEGNPRFGGNEDVRSAWEVSTWVLKPVVSTNGVRLRQAWFVKQGRPNDTSTRLYPVMKWNHNNDVWPTAEALVSGTVDCRPPRVWKRVMSGKFHKGSKLKKKGGGDESEEEEEGSTTDESEEEEEEEEGSTTDESSEGGGGQQQQESSSRKRKSKSETDDDDDDSEGGRDRQAKKAKTKTKKSG